MIRVIYEPRISSTYLKDEVWYPEINKTADEYYSYLYHEAWRTKGLTVITYSTFILDCLELISQERNIPLQVEANGKVYTKDFEEVYLIHCKAMQEVDNRKWDIKKDEW